MERTHKRNNSLKIVYFYWACKENKLYSQAWAAYFLHRMPTAKSVTATPFYHLIISPPFENYGISTYRTLTKRGFSGIIKR